MTKFRAQFDKRPVKFGQFPCDEILPGDGEDPRYDRKFTNKVVNRKALQLCSQVKDSLNLFIGTLSNNVLRDLYFDSVIPAPDSSQLLITVITDNKDALLHLQNASGLFRNEIANSINRKRVPLLKFNIIHATGCN